MTTPRVTFPMYYIDQLTHLNYSQVFLDDLVELNFANLRQQARRVATFLLSYNKVSNLLSIYKKKNTRKKGRRVKTWNLRKHLKISCLILLNRC